MNESNLASYDALLAQRPADPEVIFSRAVVLDDLGRVDEALSGYLQALAIHPDHAGANQNASFLLLQQGQFEQGWRLYEQRWRLPQGGLTWQDLPRPVWRGESLVGKHILLWTEQGFGDIFQFGRYALVLQSMGAAKVTLLVLEGKCKRLFEHSFAPAGIDVVDTVAMRNGLLVPAFDVHGPLMSLPFACKTNSLAKIPADVPYLFAEPLATQRWQEKIAQATTAQSAQPRQRVGLCWAGGNKLGDDAERSLALAQFGVLAALAKTGGVQFFSLQLGEPATQVQTLQSHDWQGLPLIDLTADLSDWADTAALIAQLDLVISCDTAVAHLAAAMGKPTWILSRFNGCWRWLEGRGDSPWYPSVRLFRQNVRGDWGGVMAEVVDAFKALAS
jgi:hypothetical protein